MDELQQPTKPWPAALIRAWSVMLYQDIAEWERRSRESAWGRLVRTSAPQTIMPLEHHLSVCGHAVRAIFRSSQR